MIVKVSFFIATSLVAFAISQHNSRKKQSSSSIIKLQDDACMETLEIEEDRPAIYYDTNDEFIQMLQEEEKMDDDMIMISTKMLENVREEEILSDLTKESEQREVNIEGKLLELYGLKEEKSCSTKLRKDLDEKLKEIGTLSDTVASLQAERKSLRDGVEQGVLAAKKLELVKKMVVQMERKIDEEKDRLKGRVSTIEERVCGFRDGDENCEREDVIEKKIRDVELEFGMRNMYNKQLELEKRELTVRLLGAQERLVSLSKMTEEKVMSKINDEISTLEHGNEELSSEIESLQKERFKMIEELVYHRWLNCCLRLEKKNQDNTPSDASKSPDPKESDLPSSYSSSSFSFSSTESSSSNSSRNSSRKSFSFMKRMITKWGCKDDSNVVNSLAEKKPKNLIKSKPGLVRRFSASIVLDKKSSTLRNKGNQVIPTSPFTENKENYGARRVRRVSFSDLVKTHYDMPSSFRRTDVEKSRYRQENSEEHKEASVVSDEDRLENIDEDDCIKRVSDKGLKENKVVNEDQMMQHLFNVLFVLVVYIFLAYLFLVY